MSGDIPKIETYLRIPKEWVKDCGNGAEDQVLKVLVTYRYKLMGGAVATFATVQKDNGEPWVVCVEARKCEFLTKEEGERRRKVMANRTIVQRAADQLEACAELLKLPESALSETARALREINGGLDCNTVVRRSDTGEYVEVEECDCSVTDLIRAPEDSLVRREPGDEHKA